VTEQPPEPILGVVDGDDLTETDGLVESTGNGLQPDDPDEQPPQDPDTLPEGTESEL
jgi:hypothetical protein